MKLLILSTCKRIQDQVKNANSRGGNATNAAWKQIHFNPPAAENRYSFKRWTIKVIYKELPDMDDIYRGLIANFHKVARSVHQTNATWTCTYNNIGNLL